MVWNMSNTKLNYESEVSFLIKENLQKYYGIEEKWFEFALFKFMIHFDKKIEKPEYHELIPFLLKELKISFQQNVVFYKKETIPFYFQVDHSLSNILDNYFMIEQFDYEKMKNLLKKAKVYARKQNHLPRKEKKYKTYRKMFMMEFIVEHYHIAYHEVNMIEGFEYNHDFYGRSVHEYYLWEKDAYLYDVKPYLLTETILEDYLYMNLHKIGDYKPIAKQTTIGEGRLDVWVRDNQSENVLIECKIVSNPKDLLWQCLNYPSFFKETFNQDITKMLVVSPLLKESLMYKIAEKMDIPVQFYMYKETFDYDTKTFSFEFEEVNVTKKDSQ